MGVRITVPEASAALGISQNELRRMLRQKSVGFGSATKVGVTKSGNPRFRYTIWLPKLLKETGLKEWPVK